MIFHLMSAGMPVTWTIVAVYESSYGIACHAAKAWSEQEEISHDESPYTGPETKPTAHLVIEMKAKDGIWTAKRHDLLMSQRYLTRQEHDERGGILQDHTSPFPLEETLRDALAAALKSALVEFGYLIPKAEWEARYPARRIISDHFHAFWTAQNEYLKSSPKEEMAFELRWSLFMPAPEGFVYPYDVARIGETWFVTKDGEPCIELGETEEYRSSDRLQPPGRSDELVKLLNSGYQMKDIPVLMDAFPKTRDDSATSRYPAILEIAKRHGLELDMSAKSEEGVLGDADTVRLGSVLHQRVVSELDAAGVEHGWRTIAGKDLWFLQAFSTTS